MHWSLAVHLVAGSKKGKENSLAQAHNLHTESNRFSTQLSGEKMITRCAGIVDGRLGDKIRSWKLRLQQFNQ
jgi:hypothetical protein